MTTNCFDMELFKKCRMRWYHWFLYPFSTQLIEIHNEGFFIKAFTVSGKLYVYHFEKENL